jgi:uncharacterized protein (DUF2336 family)
MKTRSLAAGLSGLVLVLAAAQPAVAQEATPWPELMMKMADRNKDGMVTRQEFLDEMARQWDMRHAAMMKTDKGMKAGMMDKKQFMSFAGALIDPGKIGGN